MKRTIFLSLAVLLSLLIGIPVRAQEGTPKSDQHKMSAKKRIPRPWRTKDGFQIANVPRISEDKETEFAIVRLSDAEYKKFQENPKDWVNDHRSEEHTSELQSHVNLVCRLLLEKKKKRKK